MKFFFTLLSLLCFCLFGHAQTADFYFNVLSPSSVYAVYGPGEYGTVDQAWGWDGTITGAVAGDLVDAPDDGSGTLVFCEATADDLTSKFVLIDRGTCEFSQKVMNAQTQGAIAAIIVNNTNDPSVITMGAGQFGADVFIPAIFIPMDVGLGLRAELGAGNTVSVNLSEFPGPAAVIEGQVVADGNGNCENDPGETTLGGWKVVADGDSFSSFAFTNDIGEYQLFLDTGIYDVSLSPPANGLWGTCDGETLTFTAYDTAVVDLQAFAIQDCPQLDVDIETPLVRRCFDNNTYVVKYCNLGTATAEDAYVTVAMDALTSLVDASIPYTDLGGNVFEFQLGDVGVGECGQFIITYLVSCDADFGQVVCATAEIFPDTLCIPTVGNWDGSEIIVSGNCDGTDVGFSIENQGTADMSAAANYRVLKDGQQIEAGTFQLTVGASQMLTFPADGATYRLEADQAEDYPEVTSPGAAVEACDGGSGEFSVGFFNMFPAADYGAAYDEECEEVIGAYDPNDKKGTPVGYGSEHYIEPNTDIKYLIRFQNTGTDTAFNIKIRDTISTYFDPLSLRPGSSSHHFDFELLDENIAVFSFPNIMLPDSNVNEPASNGFVSFTISQRNDVPLESVIYNSAAIYFDFNEPVITNETWHTVGIDFLPVAVTVVLQPGLQLDVFPNPMGERAVFDLHGAVFNDGKLEVFDQLGRQVSLIDFNQPRFEFRRDDLPTGQYFFKLSLDGEHAASGKILVN